MKWTKPREHVYETDGSNSNKRLQFAQLNLKNMAKKAIITIPPEQRFTQTSSPKHNKSHTCSPHRKEMLGPNIYH